MDSLIVMDLSFYLMNDAAIGEQYTVQLDVDIEGTVYTETALLTSSSGVTPTEVITLTLLFVGWKQTLRSVCHCW